MDEFIKIEMNEFLMNAGIVGLVKILKYRKAKEGMDYIINDFELLVNREFLLKLDIAGAYINLLIDELYEQTSYKKILLDISKIYERTDNLSNPPGKKELEELQELYKKMLDGNAPKKPPLACGSFKSGYVAIQAKTGIDIPALIEAICAEKDIIEKKKRLEDLESKLNDSYVREILCMKGIAYHFIRHFWDKKAFLYKETKADMKELFERDAISPLRALLNGEAKKERSKRCAECKSSYFGSKEMRLSMMEGTIDDANKKSSAFWNFNKSETFLCPTCALLYLLSPLGFNFYYKRAMFVNDTSTLKALIKANENVKGEIYWSFKSIAESQAYNVQLITKEFRLKTDYKFSMVSKFALDIFNNKEVSQALYRLSRHWNVWLAKEKEINVFDEVVKNILNSGSQFLLFHQLLGAELRTNDKDAKRIKNILTHVASIQLEQDKILLSKEEMFMNKVEATLHYISKNAHGDGLKMRRFLEKSSSRRAESMIYHLSNLAQNNRQHEFMTTVIRHHTTAGLTLHYDFLKVISNEKMFGAASTSYLLGLNGSRIKEKDEEEENVNDE